ncbi:hypothetical protein D3C71_1121600 [compost metagenome]
MKKTRLVETSLYYKIKKALSIKKSGETVITSEEKAVFNLKYNNIDESSEIHVYINDILQDTDKYSLNYPDGSVRLYSPVPANTKVSFTYSYCPVYIYEEGLNPKSDHFKYPAVAIYEDTSAQRPFELGNSKKETSSDWIIEVWCEFGGERNDITDTILEMFDEEIEIIDYNLAFPTKRDGTLNEDFNYDNQIITYATCDSINCSKAGSLDIGIKPKYLSEILINLKYIV